MASLKKLVRKYGHPTYFKLLDQQAELHERKNRDYAGGGTPLGNFERVGAILALYPGLPVNKPAIVALVYALKQLDAVLFAASVKRELLVDSPQERLTDVAVYTNIAICAIEDEIKAKKSEHNA